nr:hypothetical protein [Bradyrhizobium diazoefficiens]
MQHDDERARLLQLRRHERKHAQGAGIITEARHLLQRAGDIGAPAKVRQAQPVQLWQTSQEIDISGERHGSSWQAAFNVHPNQIVAALQNKKAAAVNRPKTGEIPQKSGGIATGAATPCNRATHARPKTRRGSMTNARTARARQEIQRDNWNTSNREEITFADCARSGRISFPHDDADHDAAHRDESARAKTTTRHSAARDIAPIAFASLST